jgi:uncharacterized membrane protein
VRFTRPADLTPGFHEEFPFVLEIAEDAPAGKHKVTIELWGSTQYETSDLLDTFTVEVNVAEDPSVTPGTFLVIIIIVIVAVLIVVIRRRG